MEKKTNPNEPINGTLIHDGLTKREYLAGQFAIGFAAAGSTGMPNEKDLARYIVYATDALIEELNREGGE